MDRFYNQPQLLNEDILPELQNEKLRKENHNLNLELHRLQKVSDDSKNLIDEVEWHKWKLKRAKSAIINYKNSALRLLRKKDLLLKEYEEIVHGEELPKDRKPTSVPVIKGLKSDVDELAKENKKLSHEKDFFKKEIEEMESKILTMEEKEINDTKEFKPNSETRVAVSTEFSNGLESFLITYSDLITLILVIFVLLYSVSKVDGGKFTEVFSSFQEKEIQLTHKNVRLDTKEFEMLKHVRELVKDNVDPESLVRSDVRTILIRLKSSDLFTPGNADLKEGAEGLILNSIQKDMKDGVKQIHIDGHTDNVPMKDKGPFPTNWELSSVRASHVARIIISKANFPPDRIVIAGYGEYRPLKPNNSDDNRAINRRVEIKILKDLKVEEEIKTIKSPKLF